MQPFSSAHAGTLRIFSEVNILYCKLVLAHVLPGISREIIFHYMRDYIPLYSTTGNTVLLLYTIQVVAISLVYIP